MWWTPNVGPGALAGQGTIASVAVLAAVAGDGAAAPLKAATDPAFVMALALAWSDARRRLSWITLAIAMMFV